MKVFAAAALAGLLFHAPASGETLKGRIIDRADAASGPRDPGGARDGAPGMRPGPAKGLSAARLTLHDSAGKPLSTRASSKTGAYAFKGLKPGRYLLAVERRDYLPSPLLRWIEIGGGDTASRDFALDGFPKRNQSPAREAGPRRTAPHGYYSRLAEGLLGGYPALYREAARPVSLGRFFDAEDSSEAWRSLWPALAWAEIESQERPPEHRIFLAHALDSALKAASLPSPPALAAYLKIRPDTLEAFAARVRAAILSPSGKKALDPLRNPPIPRSLAYKIIDGQLASATIPPARKRAFLAKAKAALGGDAARRLAAAQAARDKERKAGKPAKGAALASAASAASDALWKTVAAQAKGKPPNPVAQYHVGYRDLEEGRHPEALEMLRKAGAARSGYARCLQAEAYAHLALGDSSLAEAAFQGLTSLESPEWQARGWLGMGRIQWQTGRAEAGEASLIKSLGLDDRSDSAHAALMLLARISLERNSWQSVEPMLEKASQERPRDAEAQFWLGHMALKAHQDGVALDRFRRARMLAPRRPEFAVAEAKARFDREECGEALKVLKPLKSRLGPDGLSLYGQCLLAQGRAREAALEFRRMHQAKPSAAAAALLARALVASGSAGEAAAFLSESPFNSQAGVRMARAEALLALRQPDQARDALEPLRARSPEDPELHYLLGRCAWLEHNYPEASRELTEALRYRQDYPEAAALQGACLLKQGRAGEAHHYFKELTASSRPAWRARGLSGRGQAFAQEDKLEAAAENLAHSFQARPSAEAAAHMALVLLTQEKPEAAAPWAEKARRLDPREPLGLLAAVDVLLAGKRTDEAMALAAKGLEGDPESCDFQLVAAKAALKAGKDDEARALSLKAAQGCPGEPASHYYLGSLSARAGGTAEAKRHFGTYVANGGDAKRVPAGYR